MDTDSLKKSVTLKSKKYLTYSEKAEVLDSVVNLSFGVDGVTYSPLDRDMSEKIFITLAYYPDYRVVLDDREEVLYIETYDRIMQNDFYGKFISGSHPETDGYNCDVSLLEEMIDKSIEVKLEQIAGSNGITQMLGEYNLDSMKETLDGFDIEKFDQIKSLMNSIDGAGKK